MKRLNECPSEQNLDSLSNKNNEFFSLLSILDRRYIKQQLSDFPPNVQNLLFEEYLNFENAFDANTYLRERVKQLKQLIPERLKLHLNVSEEKLRELAENNAVTSNRLKHKTIKSIKKWDFLKSKPVNGNSAVNEDQMILKVLNAFVNEFGIREPKINNSVTLTGAIRRIEDKYWWLRNLRKVLVRTREMLLIHLRQVNNRKGKYCSDFTVKQRLIQKELQKQMLENLIIVNEENESFSLAELSDKNVSNPVNRKNELMTRMAGYEKIAKELKHKALFVTITCPSRFHNTYAKSGDPNPKWDGSTPYEAQRYLNEIWAKARSELHRRAINVYGFRIAEPQHDGTPHWHMLIFLESEKSSVFRSVIEEYALRDDGDESGAIANRCDFKEIDYSRGSATGYIAKYVSKNVNGANLDCDIDGGSPIEAAQRVEAWASCWGIRQFQQIGAGSVTVWRELRRIKQLRGENGPYNNIHEAADKGAWAEFVTLMGGVFCKRNEQPVRPLYKDKINKETGELKQSYFDGIISITLRGVIMGGKEVITRIHEWRIQSRNLGAAQRLQCFYLEFCK